LELQLYDYEAHLQEGQSLHLHPNELLGMHGIDLNVDYFKGEQEKEQEQEHVLIWLCSFLCHGKAQLLQRTNTLKSRDQVSSISTIGHCKEPANMNKRNQ
jgi:hypothetical protein